MSRHLGLSLRILVLDEIQFDSVDKPGGSLEASNRTLCPILTSLSYT